MIIHRTGHCDIHVYSNYCDKQETLHLVLYMIDLGSSNVLWTVVNRLGAVYFSRMLYRKNNVVLK